MPALPEATFRAVPLGRILLAMLLLDDGDALRARGGRDPSRRDQTMEPEDAMSAAPAPLDVSLDHDFHIDIDRALLCADCSHVYQMPRSTCPSCTSRSALPLAKVLSERARTVVVKA
jgi:hypothetical protein